MLKELRRLMNRAVRDCLVEGFEPLVQGLSLPDLDDCHVLAATIRCKADVIVTINLNDFPAAELDRWGVRALHPDDFLLELIEEDAKRVWACVQQIADARTKPPQEASDVLAQLERSGLVESVAVLRAS
jgi:hypothetical protein